jgi:hypothetical protein
VRKILDPDRYWLKDVKLEFPQILEKSNEVLSSCGNQQQWVFEDIGANDGR